MTPRNNFLTVKHWSTILLVLIGIAFSVLYLQLLSNWWYEDDPIQFSTVALIKNPLNIFIDREVIRGFGPGLLVPMQILSYWIDIKLAGFDPFASYIHSLISFLVTLVLMYAVLLNWTKDRILAFAGTMLWMLLPSTLVVHQFIAARHYLEGLMFALAAIYLTQKLSRDNKHQPDFFLSLILIGLFAAAAMLSKEIYATVLPTFLLLSGLGKKQIRLVILAILLALGYAIARIVMVDPNASYPVPLAGAINYLKFLLILPFTFSANKGGYLFYLAGAIVVTALLWRGRRSGVKSVVLLFALSSAALIAIYPTAFAVLISYKTPGTWYRATFIINTIIIIWLISTLAKVKAFKLRLAAIATMALIILFGTVETKRLWRVRLDRAAAEGKFYVANPDKLLYSEQEAYWFIFGVHKMYQVQEEHFINKYNPANAQERERLGRYSTIWRYDGTNFMPDDSLYHEIEQENVK